jgi:hypothetical protein
VDAAGNVIFSGTFFSTVDFGGGVLTSAGNDDLFLAKFNSAGIHRWSARYGDTAVNGTLGVELATDADRNIVVAGGFNATVDFGGGPLTSLGSTEVFHARFSPDGVFQAADRSGDAAGQFVRGVAICADGSALLTGSNAGNLDLGGGILPAPGASGQIFLAKFRSGFPGITSIGDVGNDQGRSVRIEFTRSGFDAAFVGAKVLSYAAFRRIDPLPAGVTPPEIAAAPGTPLLEGWEFAGSIPAFAESEYSMIVGTLADSTIAAGQHYSVFFVRGVTAAPSIFFDTSIDSGYSVDNLAPSVPNALVYDAGVLEWNESPSADFDYFTVYGSNTDNFGSAIVVDYSVDPTMDVVASPYTFYFVTATDFSGNESNPRKINTLTDVGGTPKSYVLSVSNHPNPFNPRTTVSYTVPARGPVTVAIYDLRGALVATLVNNEEKSPDAYRVEWNGRADSGAMVSSGIYFARIEHNGAERSRKMVLLK